MNVPNSITLLRIVLIPFFVFFYCTEQWTAAIIVVVFSALTDFLDGILARALNQITDLGKLLDPAADKLTQMAIAVCISITIHKLIPLLLLFVVKELFMLAGSAKLMKAGKRPCEAKWYGKVATVVFYISMGLILIFPDMDSVYQYILVGFAAVFMINAFVRYTKLFRQIEREETE